MYSPLITAPRDYQAKCIRETEMHWFTGQQNVMVVAVTGSGKTPIKGFVAKKFYDRGEYMVLFAHRDVLISQISLTLAKIGVPHNLICSKPAAREIGNEHVEELGTSFITSDSTIYVASVLTWINRDVSHLYPLIKAWAVDECHHLSGENTWQQCIEPLVNAKGMGVTATPLRADKKGLGREHGGVFDVLVEAPPMGELINRGFLSPYRIYTVPNKVDVSGINTTKSGDYNQKKLALATEDADIIGDAVEHYIRHGEGGQAIVFCVSINHAIEVAKQFTAAGIPAVALSSKSKLAERQKHEGDFRRGRLQVLVNVDLFGEGYNVPACSVVIMLRKISEAAYGLFKQQFGRMLRVFEGKEYGILLDHVGNVPVHCIHGAPHDDPEWSLEPTEKKKKGVSDKPPLSRTCPECFGFYLPKCNTPAHYICPYCGHSESDEEINEAAKELQIQAGSLVEYQHDELAQMLKKRDEVDVPVERVHQKLSQAPQVVKNSAAKNHLKRQEAQRILRQWIGSWCSHVGTQNGYTVETTQNEFNRVFGVNVFKAQSLSERLSNELVDKIRNSWHDYVSSTQPQQ